MRKNDSYKKAASELFAKGFSINHVASKIPTISQRTLFRWYDDYVKDGGTDYRKTYYIDAILEEEKPVIKTVLPVVETVDNDENWLNSATKTVKEISTNNAKIRRRLEELLFQEIGELNDEERKSDNVNYRALNCLINSIVAIQKQEWIFGSFAYLDINKAVKFLDSCGYKISEIEATGNE